MLDSYYCIVFWIIKGVDGEIIGDVGFVNDGVVGLLFDYYDCVLGMLLYIKIIVLLGGYMDSYVVNQQFVFYFYFGFYGLYDWWVYVDMIYFMVFNGGVVFVCGLVVFVQLLLVNNFRNGLFCVLVNVVEVFVGVGRLFGFVWVNEEKQWV